MRISDFFKRLFRAKAARQPPEKISSKTAMRLLKARWPRWIRGDYTLENSELIFSAISRIANALSAMPIRLYKKSSMVRNELSDLMAFAPSSYLTSSNWFKTMETCRCAYGNAYAIKVFDERGNLVSLDILDPDRVTPLVERDSHELWYRITPDEGPEYYVHNYYIIHIPYISANGHTGINPVSVLLDTLQYNSQIQTFSASQLEKGINAQIVVEAPASLGRTQREGTVQTMQETWKATGGNVLLLESGLTAKTLNLSPVDTKLFEVEKIARSRVAMVYNIPPHLLGDYSDTSFSSQEQQMLEFLTLTMLPIVTAYEQELDLKLLTKLQRQQGYHWKMNMESVLRADSSTRADVYQKAIRGGWMKPNEVRAEYMFNPDAAGNKLLISKDLTTLEWLVKNPSQSEAAPSAPQAPANAANNEE